MRMEGDGEARKRELLEEEIRWGSDGGNLLAGDAGEREHESPDDDAHPAHRPAA